jgi:hypothetical protein
MPYESVAHEEMAYRRLDDCKGVRCLDIIVMIEHGNLRDLIWHSTSTAKSLQLSWFSYMALSDSHAQP